MKIRGLILVLLCVMLVTCCGLDTSGIGPSRMIWLDGPVEVNTYVGTAVAITVHANFELSVVVIGYNLVGMSNTPLTTVAVYPVGAGMYEGVTSWTPDEPGEYNLRAYSSDGVVSHARYIRVLPLITSTPELTPATTAEMVLVTPTEETPLPAIIGQLQFYADSYTINSGECTYIRWTSAFVSQVTLDGVVVDLTGSRQVCPEVTTTYNIRGVYEGGIVEKSLTIVVISLPQPTTPVSVADTKGPTITNISKSQDSIFDGTSCGVTSNLISAKVIDESGVASITLMFRAKKTSPAQTGEWRSISMTKASGNNYQATLGIAQLTGSLPLYADGIVEFYIIARDSLGNETQSAIKTFSTTMCFG